LPFPLDHFHEDASRIVAACEEQGIIFRVLSNLFNLKMGQARVEDLEGDPWITRYAGICEGWPLAMKRALDFWSVL